jgi:hypothetical protein
MQLFTYNFTNFMNYTSPSLEMWLAAHELPEFATMLVEEMLLAQPELAHRGMCVAIYDGDGIVVTTAPLDRVH